MPQEQKSRKSGKKSSAENQEKSGPDFVFFLLLRCSGRRAYALFGALAVWGQRDLFFIHSMAWSEPLFFLFCLLQIYFIARYLGTRRRQDLWLAAASAALGCLTRYLGASLALAGAAAIALMGRDTPRGRIKDALWFAFAALAGLLVASIFWWRVFPTCYVEGVGLTTFKIASEYGVCFVFLAAAVLFWRRRSDFDPGVIRLLLASVAATIAAELAFTLYHDVYDAANMAGHLLKIVAFYLIYKAMIEVGFRRPYDLLFRYQRLAQQMAETELAKVKDQLVRQTRLAAIGQIAASIAHDVRNPLAAMRFLTQALREETPGE